MDNNYIDYIELHTINIQDTKQFYSDVFGWIFTDYGGGYTSFKNSGVKGGFEKVDQITKGATLVVIYYKDLELIKEKIINHGGNISRDIFSFPGGKRFHFIDPSGNELAVWSDQ